MPLLFETTTDVTWQQTPPPTAPQPVSSPDQIQVPPMSFGTWAANSTLEEYVSTFSKRSTKDRSASLWSDEYLALEAQLKEIQASLYRELEEMATLLEQHTKLVEVVRDTASIVRQHIATLSQVSIQIEKRMLTLRPQGSPAPATKPSAKQPVPEQVPQSAEAAEAVFGLES